MAHHLSFRAVHSRASGEDVRGICNFANCFRAQQNSSSALAKRTFSARAEAEDSRLRKDLLEVLATYRENPSRSLVPESNPVAGTIYFRLTEIDAGHLTRDTNSYHVRLPRYALDDLLLYHSRHANASD